VKRKLLLVLPETFNCAGGIQMFCRALCLAAGNWAQTNEAIVDALVLNDNSVPDELYVNSGFSSYNGAGKSKSKFIGNYLRRVITIKYDWIIFGHVSLSPLSLLTKRWNPTVKIGVVAHGVEVWQPLLKTQRLALHYVDLILAVSDYTKDEVIKHNGIPSEKIRIFHNTLDPHWKSFPPVTNLECTPPLILSVTRMNKEDRYKGIDTVIRSLPTVVQEVGPVEFRVVGQGDDIPRLQALATGLGVARYVNFMGGLPDAELREQYSCCSLFIMPSKKEGFGIVFLEAMAYAKPVIGGAHGGTPSVIKDGETGLLVDNADVVGIADSITRLLSDEDLRNKFGLAGQQRLLNEFTFERFESNLKDVLQSL
jgi:phosphatidyl-myo-inositol dimannoside synthase